MRDTFPRDIKIETNLPSDLWPVWCSSSAFSAASALVALESLTNSDAAEPADLLHAMRQTAKRGEAQRDPFDAEPERARDREGEGGVLAVMGAAQRRRPAQIERRRGAVAPRSTIRWSSTKMSAARRRAGRDRDQPRPAAAQPARDRARGLVVDADHRESACATSRALTAA